MQLTQRLKDEYKMNFERAKVLDGWQVYVSRAGGIIAKYADIYKEVSLATGVPWYVIAIIHGMESSFDFQTHLHNGDPLSARTVQVPEGRPTAGEPPFTWVESAIDALKYDGAASQKDWSTEAMLFFFEQFNGWGYRSHLGHLSQYLWSATTVATPGKYVADGVWNEDAQSEQVGCVAMLKELALRGLLVEPSDFFEIKSGGLGMVQTTFYGAKSADSLITSKTDELIAFLQKHPEGKKISFSLAEGKPPASKSVNQKLLEYCTSKDNYLKVANEVLEFYPDGTSNGCAAYCSQFLRDIGIKVPIAQNKEGYNISLVAQSLADWLIGSGWQKVVNRTMFSPGDVIVTQDDPQWPGFAAHIWIMATTVDANGFALCVDNQGFKYNRNVTAAGPKTPARYALHSPV